MRFIQIKYINFIFDILEYSTILPIFLHFRISSTSVHKHS